MSAAVRQQHVVVAGRPAFRVASRPAHADFWSRVGAGSWEPQTFRVLARILDPACSFIDIGAWIGPTALYGAGLARLTYAFEPDPVAFAELRANVRANPALEPKMRLLPFAVAARSGAVPLYAGGLYWREDSRFGDSMSGLLGSGPARQPSRMVQAFALDEFMEMFDVHDCSLVKMDIEGGEYDLIAGGWRGLQAFGMPALYVSFHAPPPLLRESLVMPCLEELARCYRFFRAGAALEPAQPLVQARAVHDWTDDEAGSPWSRLERLLGQGLLAANTE